MHAPKARVEATARSSVSRRASAAAPNAVAGVRLAGLAATTTESTVQPTQAGRVVGNS